MNFELIFKKLRAIGFISFSGTNHDNILSFRFFDGDVDWKSNIFELWFRPNNTNIFYWWIDTARLHPAKQPYRIDEGKKENLTEDQVIQALDQKIQEHYGT